MRIIINGEIAEPLSEDDYLHLIDTLAQLGISEVIVQVRKQKED